MKNTVLFFMAACIATTISAQPVIKNQRVYGGNNQDLLAQMCFAKDGGLLLAGSSSSGKTGNKTTDLKGNDSATDYWLIMQSKFGEKKWERDIGGSSYDVLKDIKPTKDSGFIIVGTSTSNKSGDKTANSKGGEDYWVVKINRLGEVEWDKTIGGDDADDAQSVLQTSDGGYLIAGNSMSGISGDKTAKNINGGPLLWHTYDIWLVKLDASGNIQWDKTIGGTADDGLIFHIYNPHQGSNRHVLVCTQAPDGGYVIGTSSNSNISANKTANSYNGSPDYWVVKTDANGKVLWDKTIGGSGEDYLSALDIAEDGSILVGGYSWSDASYDKTQGKQNCDYWIVKLNSTGNILWDKTIGGGANDILQEIQHTSDGGFILAGNSNSGRTGDKTWHSRGGYDYWIVKINSAGNVEWDKTFGGSADDVASDVVEYEPNVYYIGGWSPSPPSGNKRRDAYGQADYWILKLASNADSTGVTSELITNNKLNDLKDDIRSFLVYPNPATSVLHIQHMGKATFVLTDQTGKRILGKTINGSGELNVANLPAGIYYLTNMATKATQKVVITR